MRILPEYSSKIIDVRSNLQQRTPNRLVKEKSPYLLQHALNPVDWFSWGEEAFQKARKEDKPIFLSIGYSTCYWCHVMEREIFENQSIADMMNLMVVSIKVDREERPDLDQVYMKALQAMIGSGGWPMSMFLTPDLKPFYAGTYIPPEDRFGRKGFPNVLSAVHRAWTNNRSKVLESSDQMFQFLLESAVPASSNTLISEQVLDTAFDQFEKNFDINYGGFGEAPKFPQPSILNFLLRVYHRTGNCTARDMVLSTLQKMAEGGIYDQLGGGFHRYSTDERWLVPHFEKMLYDQAQMVICYLEVFQISHDPFFAQIAREILTYVERSLISPEGGFYSAEDAESAVSPLFPEKKREGAFYLWKMNEMDRILNERERKIIHFIFGIEENGNINLDSDQEFLGDNILHIVHSVEEAAHTLHENIEDIQAYFDIAKVKLFEARNQRPRPHLDDKILLSWNGLMISAFARASRVLNDTTYLEEASRAARFLLSVLKQDGTKKMSRRYRDGNVDHDAQLADYAFFVQGLLDLYEASFQVEWLQTAVQLTEEQTLLFYDHDHGGFYDTGADDRSILVRMKEGWDQAEPSGNSVAILNLLRMSEALGKKQYREMASKSIECFSAYIEKNSYALPQMLVAINFSFSKPLQIILSGQLEHPVIGDMVNEIYLRFLPNKILLFADGAEGQKFLSAHIPFWGTLGLMNGQQAAYICENYTCELPTSDIQTLAWILDDKSTK